MNQWGETGLVVVSADVLVFPVLGLYGVFVDCLDLFVDMRIGYRVDHGYIEVISVIVTIVVSDVRSQDLRVGVRVVFLWARVGEGVDFVKKLGFFTNVVGVGFN